MFSSFFSTSAPVDPNAPTFHSVASRYKDNELFGELAAKDSEWLCAASGFVTETQVFYTITDDGVSLMCQVIHSAVGLWYPTIQFTCKIHDPKNNTTIWKSINVNNFVTPPPGLDKRSSKADEFSITYKASPGSDHPESYTIRANLAADLQFSVDIARPASIPGFKVGKGEQGGYSYFGADTKKADGYVIHRFWPRFDASGHVIANGKADAFKGVGMFVHAIQGMRPNLVAQSWNFVHFQSPQHGGVSAIQMEYKTLNTYGPKGTNNIDGTIVNVGSLVIGGKLASVTAETIWPGETPSADAPRLCRAFHLKPEFDPDTTYQTPTEVAFRWAGPSVVPDAPGTVTGSLNIDLGTVQKPRGLIEKVDVLAEIPYVIKMAVNYVAGTKPYIYQWFNPATLKITGPDGITPGLSGGLEAEGLVYNEATFISE
ncbi:hypothetical protein AX16_002621 [Volvariella volvacea WC 439]|nr:hypothetical protein AX16_002621 [Volvariella volvacea WC 439]